MTFQQELSSWNPFYRHEAQPVPQVGQQAPTNTKLMMPPNDQKPAVIAFLRHCGCPFAEKTFQSLRDRATEYQYIRFIAISHSDESATSKWVENVGGAGSVEVIVDTERKIYASFGLPASSFWHVLNPKSMSSALNMGKTDNISVRPTESGSRWQTAGLFATDAAGKLTYNHPAKAADDLGDLNAAIMSVKGS